MSDTADAPKPPAEIPEALREQLRKASKKGIESISPEDRKKFGKQGWAARVRKAQEAERKEQEQAQAKPEQNQEPTQP